MNLIQTRIKNPLKSILIKKKSRFFQPALNYNRISVAAENAPAKRTRSEKTIAKLQHEGGIVPSTHAAPNGLTVAALIIVFYCRCEYEIVEILICDAEGTLHASELRQMSKFGRESRYVF